MTLTEEDILKVFQDSDEEEVSCLDENKDLKFWNQNCPLNNEGVASDFLPIKVKQEKSEKSEGSREINRSSSNLKAPRNFQGVPNQIEPLDFLQIIIKQEKDEKPEGSRETIRSSSNLKTDKKSLKTFQNRRKKFICEKCGRGFYRSAMLRAHENLHKLDSYIERQDQKPRKTKPSSTITESKAENMMREVDKHFLKTYICLDCEKRKMYLERSSVIATELKKLSPSINKAIYCLFCGKKFLQIRQMNFV